MLVAVFAAGLAAPTWGAGARELLSTPIDPFGVAGFIRLLHDAEADELILAATPQDLRSTAYDQFFSTWDVSASGGVETQPSPPLNLSTFGPWSETIRHPVSGHYRAELVLERPRPDGRLEASRRFTVAFVYNAVSATAELDTEAAPRAPPQARRAGSLASLRRTGGLEIVRAEATGVSAVRSASGLFRPEERAVSVDFAWRGARPNSTLSATWYYLEGAERLQWLTQRRTLTTPQGEGRLTFIIDDEEQWFTGDYVVELSSAGQLLREVFFSVRPGGGSVASRPLEVVALTVSAPGVVPQPAGPGAVMPSNAERVELRVTYRGGASGQRLTSRWFFVEGLVRRPFSESAVEILRPDHEAAFSFALQPGEGWLPGSYEVDVFSGSELVARATYRVSSPAGRARWPSVEPARVAVRPEPVRAGGECIVEGRGFTPNGLIPLEGIVLTDASGRPSRLRGEPIRISPQGTFAFRFRLPLAISPGVASLKVLDQSQRTATATFQVARPLTVKERLKEVEREWKDIFK